MKNIIWLFVIASVIMFTYLINSQLNSYFNYEKVEKELSENLEKHKRYQELISNEKEYFESDAYIEKVAREIYGYVRQDETVFINSTQK